MSDTGRPVIVLARHGDDWAAALARRLAPALLMTSEDLSRAGWRYRVGAPSESVAVIGRRRIPAAGLAGVVVRLPWVDPSDLLHIHARDQAYVAAEMNAFLVAWLSVLPCPVLNRPRPGCLTGPAWRPEEWLARAARLGIPILPGCRSGNGPPGETVDSTLTLVGARHLGKVAPVVLAGARRLAALAGVALLSLCYVGRDVDARLAAAAVWPERPARGLPAALEAYFRPPHAARP